MKKKLLLSLVGVMAIGGMLGVKAETIDVTGNQTKTAKVGEVQAPVYKVEISWGELTYDNVYNRTTGKREWREKIECKPVNGNINEAEFASNGQEYRIYEDEQCTQNAFINSETDYNDISNYYYATAANDNGFPAGEFHISDNSSLGRVIPTLAWSSNSNYNYVKGIFKQDFYDEDLQRMVFKKLDSNTLTKSTSGNYPDGEMGASYDLKLELENDETKEIKPASAGDTIGTVTISFENV